MKLRPDKIFFICLFTLSNLFSCIIVKKNTANLNVVKWIKGSADCKTNTDPAIQVLQYNYNTYILRQNKCVNYEAPFMFLFMGDKKALLMDTGATEDATLFPLRAVVDSLISIMEAQSHTQLALVVAHTHNHDDHTAGDSQFANRPNTTVINGAAEAVATYFNLVNWPLQSATFNLGNRIVEIIPIPGHELAAIALYDAETRLLLSGDSFYPGRLYIRDWTAFTLSTQRLVNYSQQHRIKYLLGNHIEMSNKPTIDYPTGTKFQPDEHRLPLTVKDLVLLNSTLKKIGDTPTYQKLADFIIYPVKNK